MAPRRFTTVPIAELMKKGLLPDPVPPPHLVLVVDDERAIAETLTWILERAGFAATLATCGEDALEIARLTPPELLLSDVVMPGMNGIELALQIRHLVSDCKVLLLSGQAQAVNLFAGMQLAEGHFRILAKPIPPLELLEEIALLLDEPHFARPLAVNSTSPATLSEKKDRQDRRTGMHER